MSYYTPSTDPDHPDSNSVDRPPYRPYHQNHRPPPILEDNNGDDMDYNQARPYITPIKPPNHSGNNKYTHFTQFISYSS